MHSKMVRKIIVKQMNRDRSKESIILQSLTVNNTNWMDVSGDDNLSN